MFCPFTLFVDVAHLGKVWEFGYIHIAIYFMSHLQHLRLQLLPR